MEKYKYSIGIIAAACVLALTSCVEVLPPSATIIYSQETSVSQITSAAASALQSHDFVVSVVDPATGVVVTDWRRVSDIQKENLNLALIGDRLQERMRLSLVVNKDLMQISIKPTKEKHSKTAGWQEINLDEGDKDLVTKVASDLSTALDLPASSVSWIDPLHKPKPPPAPPMKPRHKIVTVAFFCAAAIFVVAGVLTTRD